MEITKTGPKRLRRTRRDTPEGQVSQWPEGYNPGRPVREPLPDVGADAVDSTWIELREVDDYFARLDAYVEAIEQADFEAWADRTGWHTD